MRICIFVPPLTISMDPIHKDVRSILIIDDDRDDYELVNEAIQEINPGISVTHVSNCEEISKYRNHLSMK